MSRSGNGTRILLVDDDDTFREVMSAELARRGYAVDAVATGQRALERAFEQEADVILLDMRLPDLDGIEVLKRLREREVRAGVVLLTGHGTIDTAVAAIRLGAYDYLEKPCPFDKLEVAVQRTHEHLRLVERGRVLEDGFTPSDAGIEFVGTSSAFAAVRHAIARIGPTDSTTLVLGETGVGKEMVARLLHAQSPRKDRPFVVVDCATLQEHLLQSELFGHEKGAFTGAVRQKHGLFEVATGGTIFLDEIGETSLEVQAKLLRVLETSRFRRLGGTKEIAVDVRVVSATNRDLKEAIKRGHFREDLYFRLSTLTVQVPPLRERPEDTLTLVEHFTKRLNLRLSLSRRFSPEAVAALTRYAWPGNVRELTHVLEQVLVMSDTNVIPLGALPPAIRAGGAWPEGRPAPDRTLPLREMQRRHILAAMEEAGGNRAQAARTLQVSERNLYRLLKKYGEEADPTPVVPDRP